MEFEGIYNAHFDQIYKYIYYMISDSSLAEELTQETFLKVYKSNFRNESSISTYIRRIARNLVYDTYRRNALIKWISFKREHEGRDEAYSPHEWLIASEERRNLYESLQKLKPEYREVVIYRKIEELSIAETAEILNWSEVKVANTLRAAIKALKKQIGGAEDEFGQSFKGIE